MSISSEPQSLRFAVVDLETTGGPPSEESITEIALVLMCGSKIEGEWDSLLDPGNSITPFVQRLTGITDEMVRGKPSFTNVSEKLYELLEGRILVAHNIAFDYGYLRQAFSRHALEISPLRLCTLRLARKTFPGLPAYGLGNLGMHLPMPTWEKHRALGDAKASAWILQEALHKLSAKEFLGEIKGVPPTCAMLPGWNLERLGQLPVQAGVLWVHGRQGQVLYMCPARDLHAQALVLLRDGSKRNPLFSVRGGVESFSWQVTGSQVLAHLLCAEELHKILPPCNKKIREVNSACLNLNNQLLVERLGDLRTFFYMELGQFSGYLQLNINDAFPFPGWQSSLQKIGENSHRITNRLHSILNNSGQKYLQVFPLASGVLAN